MINKGICSSLRSNDDSAETWHTLKLGLAVFIITAGKTPDQQQQMRNFFTKTIPEEIQAEMLEERRFVGLRSFMNVTEKVWMTFLIK